MMNLRKLIAAAAICAVLAMWAVALARSAATDKVSGGDTFANSIDYATDAPVSQYWAVEEFISYE